MGEAGLLPPGPPAGCGNKAGDNVPLVGLWTVEGTVALVSSTGRASVLS